MCYIIILAGDTYIDMKSFIHRHFRTILVFFLFFSVFLFGQSPGTSPCQDKLYIDIKIKIAKDGLDSLTTREWDYYKLMDTKCVEFSKQNEEKTAQNNFENEIVEIEKEKLAQKKMQDERIYCLLAAAYFILVYLPTY